MSHIQVYLFFVCTLLVHPLLSRGLPKMRGSWPWEGQLCSGIPAVRAGVSAFIWLWKTFRSKGKEALCRERTPQSSTQTSGTSFWFSYNDCRAFIIQNPVIRNTGAFTVARNTGWLTAQQPWFHPLFELVKIYFRLCPLSGLELSVLCLHTYIMNCCLFSMRAYSGQYFFIDRDGKFVDY